MVIGISGEGPRKIDVSDEWNKCARTEAAADNSEDGFQVRVYFPLDCDTVNK
jgi:hypothetical protein